MEISAEDQRELTVVDAAGPVAIAAGAVSWAAAGAAGAEPSQQISTALVSVLGVLVGAVAWLMRRLETRAEKEGEKADRAQSETNQVLTKQVANLAEENRKLNEEIRDLQRELLEQAKGDKDG